MWEEREIASCSLLKKKQLEERKMNTLLFARVHRPSTCARYVHYNNRQDIVTIIRTTENRKQRNYFEYLCFLSFTVVVFRNCSYDCKQSIWLIFFSVSISWGRDRVSFKVFLTYEDCRVVFLWCFLAEIARIFSSLMKIRSIFTGFLLIIYQIFFTSALRTNQFF